MKNKTRESLKSLIHYMRVTKANQEYKARMLPELWNNRETLYDLAGNPMPPDIYCPWYPEAIELQKAKELFKELWPERNEITRPAEVSDHPR
jgi:hypothetical protein